MFHDLSMSNFHGGAAKEKSMKKDDEKKLSFAVVCLCRSERSPKIHGIFVVPLGKKHVMLTPD